MERLYWDECARDPDVDAKYICDMPIDVFIKTIEPLHGQILDLGCGVGRLADPIARAHPESDITGVDVSPSMILIAKDRQEWARLHFCLNDGRELPFVDNHFDCVYSVLMFQHIDDETKRGYINEAYRVLRPGGKFVVQFVLGEHHGPFDHNTTFEDMSSWAIEAGFRGGEMLLGIGHELWGWIDVRKPS